MTLVREGSAQGMEKRICLDHKESLDVSFINTQITSVIIKDAWKIKIKKKYHECFVPYAK